MVVSVAHTSTSHAHIDSVLISSILRHSTHTQSTHIRGIASCLPVSNGFHRPFAWYVLCVYDVRCAPFVCVQPFLLWQKSLLCVCCGCTTAAAQRKRNVLLLEGKERNWNFVPMAARVLVMMPMYVTNKRTHTEVVVRETTKLMEFGTNIFLWCCCAVLLSLLFFSRSACSRSVSECVFICVYRSLYDDCVCDSTCSFFLNLTHSPSIRSSNSVIVELSWCKHQPD